MKIGASLLIQQWGRPMSYHRNGVLLFEFKGRIVRPRPFTEDLSYSLEQNHLQFIATATDFISHDVKPQKFDLVKYQDEDYTVQRGYFAGADEDELCKLDVIGGTV